MERLDEHRAAIRRGQRLLAIVDSSIEAAANQVQAAQLAALVPARSQLAEAIKAMPAPVSIIPFYLNPQMLLWPAIYTTLGWLRLQALAQLRSIPADQPSARLALIQEARPFGQFGSAIPALSALASFLFPLVQLFQ